jgi:geranylgeranyl diphosphate synthase, type II
MDLRKTFDNYLKENNFSENHPPELYEPLDYILSLGGKRIRPLLTLMACQLFSEDITAALPIAYGIEIFHNFSLLHDDIMDESTLRRGHATVHKKYDTNTAILSGDVMLVYAYKYICKTPSNILANILEIFNEVATGVCEGQQMDMNFETAEEVSIQEYIRMIELKTSILIYGAMKMGAISGGADKEESELVGEFGRNMGIAFQLQDDFLDTYGKQAKVGKRIGGDILQNKKTYLVIKALELGDSSQKRELRQLLSETVDKWGEEQKIKRVKEIFTETGIPGELKKIIGEYSGRALKNLVHLKIPSSGKSSLKEFLKELMNREH